MTYELTNPDRFVMTLKPQLDEDYDPAPIFKDEEITSLIEEGAWDPDEYDLIESFSTSMNLLRDRRLYITTVAESFDRKIALAIITDERDHIRAFVSYSPEKIIDYKFEMKEVRLYKGWNDWFAIIDWVDPIEIALLTKKNLWSDIWRQYPTFGC